MPTNLRYSCRFRLGRGALPRIRVILLIRLNANQMLEQRISRTDILVVGELKTPWMHDHDLHIETIECRLDKVEYQSTF